MTRYLWLAARFRVSAVAALLALPGCTEKPFELQAVRALAGKWPVLITLLLLIAILTDSGVVLAKETVQLLDLKSLQDDGLPVSWEKMVNHGNPKIAIRNEDSEPAICLDSQAASFSINKSLNVGINRYPYVRWRWKVHKLPEGGDFRDADRNDQAAQLFVTFGSFFTWRAISYIWDTTAPVDSTGREMLGRVAVVVVKSGTEDVGKWIDVTRNVHIDYMKLFGSEPTNVSAIRLQINSQHTGTGAESCFSSVELRGTP